MPGTGTQSSDPTTARGRRPVALVALVVVLALAVGYAAFRLAGPGLDRHEVTGPAVTDPGAAGGEPTGPDAAASGPGSPGPAGRPTTVLVDATRTVGALPAGTLGLSFEKPLVTTSRLDPSRGNLTQLLRTLSEHGHLRFGGNQLDSESWWQSGDRPVPSHASSIVTPQAIDRLAALTRESGWDVELGVNLKHLDTEAVRGEVAYAADVLGPALLGIECGNEPDLYKGDDHPRYPGSWTSCADAVGGLAPLIGPNDGVQISTPFLDEHASRLRLATAHYYPMTACKDGDPSIEKLLSAETVTRQTARWGADVRTARSHGLAFRMDETNSVSCEGADGVSNVYAASLWALDHALLGAQMGASGLNFHGRLEVCSGNYAPLCATDEQALAANHYTPSPTYYGMLMVAQLGTGDMLPTGGSGPAGLRSYAVRGDDGTVRVLLLDKDAPGGAPLAVDLRGLAGSDAARAITLRAPSLSSPASEISVSGARVDDDGRFQAPEGDGVGFRDGGYRVVVPTGTAVVVTIPRATAAAVPVTGGQVRGEASGRCPTLADGATVETTAVVLGDCGPDWTRRWDRVDGALVNPFTGRCLGTPPGHLEEGTRVQLFDCRGDATQRWTPRPDGTLAQEASGRCLDAVGRGTAAGTALQLWTCGASSNQLWSVESSADNATAVPGTVQPPDASGSLPGAATSSGG